MFQAVTLALVWAGSSVCAAPVDSSAPEGAPFADYIYGNVTGMRSATVHTSAGGKAICIAGIIDVAASATHLELDINEPANDTELTSLVLDVLRPQNITSNSTTTIRETKVSGTYSIFSELCFPLTSGPLNITTIHFLIHSGGYDRRYWDLAPGYSYIDTAASHGHATFSYDRLAVGLSTTPDPIKLAQKPLQVAIAHELIQKLRTGALLNLPFSHIIGVGAYFGSSQIHTLTSQYPSDLDAAVLTSFTVNHTGEATAIAALDVRIANKINPGRWLHLSNGYVAAADAAGVQFYFLHWPDYSADLALGVGEEIRQPVAIGEIFGATAALEPSNFAGPVLVVNGANDFPLCEGNCWMEENAAEELLEFAYPQRAEGSDWHVVEGSGHAIAFHYGAEGAWEWVLGWAERNGF